MILEKYSLGHGDRFGHQGKAQLGAVLAARATGISVVPVWNKSHREHSIIGTTPDNVRSEADAAVKALNADCSYYVDADHINLGNVDGFIAGSNFFTLDVAESIGTPCDAADIDAFVSKMAPYMGELKIEGIDQAFTVTEDDVRSITKQYLGAVKEAGEIYRHILAKKGEGNFVPEVSMDETDTPQTPVEMFFILAAIAQEGIPAQTIAPRFTGRFNKGVDYVGDADIFEKEFREDIAVIAMAIKEFGLPDNLKLSVHSGSDKFKIYAAINRALKATGAGLHLKTAGTTWLEEIIGLADADGDGLVLAKEIYAKAYAKTEALCAPYASVIDIDPTQLPDPEVVNDWTSEQYVKALRHDLSCPDYNPHLRQLLHVGYKIAADMGERFITALEKFEGPISKNVQLNILERHLKPIFGGL